MEKISDTTRISALLQKVLEQRSLLTIKLSNRPTPFSSAIIDVNREAGFFVIDELKPEAGNELLQQNTSLHVEGYLDGVVISFAATVIELGTEDGISFYKLPIPTQIDYHQRRQAVRIKLSAANPLTVSFSAPEHNINLEGEVEDLSLGGLRARFKKALPQQLEDGMKLSCSFFLPPDKKEKINCEFIIRVVKHEQYATRPPFLGGQFINMEKQMERKLQRVIMTLQRASRQKENF